MNLNKFYYFLVVLLCSISFTACSDDDDKQTVPHIELTASMSAFYNPQNEMFRLLGTKRSFSQNETFFFSHP